jgi:hypothetical protein
MWGAIHIAFLAGVRNRVRTLATWLVPLGGNRRAERTTARARALAASDQVVHR